MHSSDATAVLLAGYYHVATQFFFFRPSSNVYTGLIIHPRVIYKIYKKKYMIANGQYRDELNHKKKYYHKPFYSNLYC